MAAVYVPIAVLFFVLLWLLVTALVARLGGWRVLAERYEAPYGFEPERRLRFQSVVLRRVAWFPARYRGSVSIGLGAAGLHLAPLLVFRFQHSPLLIPWGAVSACTEGSLLGLRWVDLTVRDAEPTLRFYGRTGDAVAEEWRRSTGPAEDRR